MNVSGSVTESIMDAQSVDISADIGGKLTVGDLIINGHDGIFTVIPLKDPDDEKKGYIYTVKSFIGEREQGPTINIYNQIKVSSL